MATWYWSADTSPRQLWINHNMEVQYQWCTYGNGATLFSRYGTYVRTYVRTDSHVRNKIFWDRWDSKFSEVWGSTRWTMVLRSSAIKWFLTFSIYIDPMQKWLPLNYYFVFIQNSLTNPAFEIKILKNLLSWTRLMRHFWTGIKE